MVAFKKLTNLTAIAIGTGAGLFTYYYQQNRKGQSFVQNSWTNSTEPVNPCSIWNYNWDFREPKSLVRPLKNDSIEEQNRFNSDLDKVRPKSVRHIILVRHGEYLDIGDSDETHKLTDRGRIQAKYTGERLRDLGINWHKIYVSTMTRAKETAELVLNEIKHDPKKVKFCNMLREGAPIPPQPPVGHWRPEECQFFRDGSRIEAAFRKYFYRAPSSQTEDTYTLIVGHGNVIRYFVCRALQIPAEAWLRITINHASITWLTISPSGNVSIKYLGDTGFMPPKYLTNKIPRTDSKGMV